MIMSQMVVDSISTNKIILSSIENDTIKVSIWLAQAEIIDYFQDFLGSKIQIGDKAVLFHRHPLGSTVLDVHKAYIYRG